MSSYDENTPLYTKWQYIITRLKCRVKILAAKAQKLICNSLKNGIKKQLIFYPVCAKISNMKKFLSKTLHALFICVILICVIIAGSFVLLGCPPCGDKCCGGGCDGSCGCPCDDCKKYVPGLGEIGYYKLPDSFWLKLVFPDGELRDYVKWHGNHNGEYHEIFYYDSLLRGETVKKCIARITKDVYAAFKWENDGWTIDGDFFDAKAAGKAAYELFFTIFTGMEGAFVSEQPVDVDGIEVPCKKYSQTAGGNTSFYWRPAGIDFWIKCESFMSGLPFEIHAAKLDMSLSALPEFVILPFLNTP